MRVFKKAAAFLALNLVVVLVLQFFLGLPYGFEDHVKAYCDGDYDSVVIGTSYGYNLVTNLLPDGDRVYNISRPRVPIVDYLYIVKQLNEDKGIRRIYYDISVPYWTGQMGDINRIRMSQILTGKNQLEYFCRVLLQENYNDFFFRYELNHGTLEAIPRTVKAKLQRFFPEKEEQPAAAAPRTLQQPETGVHLLSADVTPNVQSGEPGLPVSNLFSPEQVQQKSVDAFEELAEYCSEHDIELILYINAFPKERLLADNMGDVHDYFQQEFSKFGLPLYDMNYVKWELLEREIGDYMDMDGHMNSPLRERYTKLFAEILTSDDPSAYFEDSYDDVLQKVKAASGYSAA